MGALLKSKTFYTGVASVIAGITIIVQGEVEAGIQLISTGLAAIFIRDAVAKVK